MNAVLKKLNYKAHTRAVLMNVPDALDALITEWKSECEVAEKVLPSDSFVLIFTPNETSFRTSMKEFKKIKSPELAVMWIAYPKGTSKKIKSDINRDSIWKIVREYGFDLNRNVAIDDDWSALRMKPLG